MQDMLIVIDMQNDFIDGVLGSAEAKAIVPKAVEKIKYQLQSQGFKNIADFSRDGDKAYFMQDTIHMGWNGWVAMDKAVNPFLTEKQSKPNYQINKQFLSKKWANYTKEPDSFY